jgi:Mg-chelatase subunit ChlD
VDTSGSMQNKVRSAGGEHRPKNQIAREALDKIVNYTTQWQKSHPDRALQVSVINFSSSATVLEPMKPFDPGVVRSALERIPMPGGGTAIGEALITAFQSLYSSGCVRKHVVCITDGENTAGAPPDRVARQLFDQTGGEVELHFVAFDTSASKFGFLRSVNGHVVEASDEQQLGTKLAEIYEKNILAEAMPAEKQ